MNLSDQGYRFIVREGRANWVHPLEIRSGDVDATDMTDEELLAALEGGAA